MFNGKDKGNKNSMTFSLVYHIVSAGDLVGKSRLN